jgi:segregation and condensation protein A
MEEAQRERALRGYASSEEKLFLQAEYPEEELVGIDLFTLMRAFRRVMERHSDSLKKPSHVIRRYPYDIEEVKGSILRMVEEKERIDFLTLILEHEDRIFAVFSFLGILELVQGQYVSLTMGEGYNNFWLNRKEAPEPEEGELTPENTK